MRLTLDQIDIRNFKLIGDLSLTLLPGPGLHFLRGRNERYPRMGANGVAKSSIWDALCWCLFGRTPDGLRNTDIEPWNGDNKTSVRVWFRVDGDEHWVERDLHPNRLLLDDRVVGQETIEQLLGIPFEVFCHTVLLAQEQPLFFDLPPKGKMELFSEVLDLERWEQRSKVAGKEAQAYHTEVAQIEGEMRVLQAEADRNKQMLENIKYQTRQWNQEQDRKLGDLEKNLAAMRSRYETVQARCDELNLELDGAWIELRPIQRDIRQLQVRAAGINARIKIHKGELLQLGTADVCPTCGRKFADEGARRKHRRELQIKIARLEKETAPAELERMLFVERKFQKRVDEAQLNLNTVAPMAAELKAQVAAAEQVRTEKRKADNPWDRQRLDLTRRQSKLLVEIKKAEVDLISCKRRAERHQFWVKGFKDVRLFIVEEILTELQMVTNSMLDEVGLLDWEVRYEIERETKSGSVTRGLNVVILSPDNDRPVRWESFSGGEKRRLRIIGALALSEVLLNHAGVEPSIEILDEPTRGLSERGVRDLIEFLADRGERLDKAIWFTDHHAVESREFASVMTVVRDRDGSHLADARG